MYGGRNANKESGKQTLEKYINDIGKVKLVFHHELNSIKSYSMYSENKEYLGYARQHSDGSWTFDNYPAIVIRKTINSPYAVNITGC
jgi:hypothetical protein